MPSLRITKVNELIRQQLGEIMGREMSLKPGVLVTIAKVDTTPDLRHARVFVSVFPETEISYARQALKNELSGIQKKLFPRLHMKPSPRISFEIDTTEQEADIVEKILKDLE